jgi:predicted dehydrogenase
MTQDNSKRSAYTTRREILKASSLAAATLAVPSFAWAGGADTLKIGLIGCGGRGTGAVVNNLSSVDGVELVAMGDIFPDKLQGSLAGIKGELGDKANRVKVTPDKMFIGLDAYEKVLATDIDLVILATPPGFRPQHFEAAVKAGKHVFMEKPVAVDAPGVRKVLAAGEMAMQKKLGVVAGTQRRHDFGYNEIIKRIHDGAIGDIVAAQCYWNQGPLWHVARTGDMSDAEWQLRNWYYFAWMSGDHYVEQHIHNIDVVNWAIGTHPKSAYGMGGRQVRTEPMYGHIYDHFAVEFEYPNGVRTLSMARQMEGTDANVSERIVGTKGTSNAGGEIYGANAYKYTGKRTNPYDQEHVDLVASIREGKPLNEAKMVAESTLTAIMGRMSAYSGKRVTWEQAMNSTEVLMPAELMNMKSGLPMPAVPVPGKYVVK